MTLLRYYEYLIFNRKHSTLIPKLTWMYLFALSVLFGSMFFLIDRSVLLEMQSLYFPVSFCIIFIMVFVVRDIANKSYSAEMLDYLRYLRLTKNDIFMIKQVAVLPVSLFFQLILFLTSALFKKSIWTLFAVYALFGLILFLSLKIENYNSKIGLKFYRPNLMSLRPESKYFALLQKDISDVGLIPFILVGVLSALALYFAASFGFHGGLLFYFVLVISISAVTSDLFRNEDKENSIFYLKYCKVKIEKYVQAKLLTVAVIAGYIFAVYAITGVLFSNNLWTSLAIGIAVFMYVMILTYFLCYVYALSLHIKSKVSSIFDISLLLLAIFPFVVIIWGLILRTRLSCHNYFWSYYA